MKKSIPDIFREGILTNNPTFVQLLGMCPTLAVTTSVVNALGMGAAVIAVLSFSNLFISLLRNIIPKQIRIASYIVIISGFVTAVEMIIKAYFPAINRSLGLFIPLIVVNCIILARAEAFASKNGPLASFCDGIATGIGFMLALISIALVRELLGSGMLFSAADGSGGVRIFGDWFKPASIFLMPSGAFITLGCLIALSQKIRSGADERARRRRAEIDLIDSGYHATLMRDPESGRIVRRLPEKEAAEAPAEEALGAEEEFIPETAPDAAETPEAPEAEVAPEAETPAPAAAKTKKKKKVFFRRRIDEKPDAADEEADKETFLPEDSEPDAPPDVGTAPEGAEPEASAPAESIPAEHIPMEPDAEEPRPAEPDPAEPGPEGPALAEPSAEGQPEEEFISALLTLAEDEPAESDQPENEPEDSETNAADGGADGEATE